MSKIRHHLTDDILMGYATGTLPEAFSRSWSPPHVSLCDDCRAQLMEYEALGGEVLEGRRRGAGGGGVAGRDAAG